MDSSSPVDDKRMRLRELRAPVWGTKVQKWRRVLERKAIERRHLNEDALLDRRRRDLESAVDPTVPKTLKGLDAPTESERTAHEITHLPLAETCILRRGIEAPHVRLTPLERDERPIIAVDFSVKKARADDGGADDDVGTFLAIIDSSTGCTRAIASETKRSHRLPCRVSGRLRDKFVCWEVQIALRRSRPTGMTQIMHVTASSRFLVPLFFHLMTPTTMMSPSAGCSLTHAEDEPITLKKKVCRPVCRRPSVMIERGAPL